MRPNLLLFLVAAYLFFAFSSLEAQETKPGLSYEQRIELAKKMLKPVREIATKDQDSPERLHYFTAPMASIDPVCTAKFILENPANKDGMLYDHPAMLTLMSQAKDLDEEVLLQLVHQAEHFRQHYVLAALKSLPKENAELRSQLAHLAFESKEFNHSLFQSTIQVASLFNSKEESEKLNARIAAYYESGKASQALKAMKKQMAGMEEWQKSNLRYSFGQLAASAPEKYRKKFVSEKGASQYDVLWQIVTSDDFPKAQRLEELNKVERFEYGDQMYLQVMNSVSLGLIAMLDLEKATKWADEIPEPAVKIWVHLLIAPTLAKTDKPAAIKLVKDCYRELNELDRSDQIPVNYGYPPSLLSGLGLKIVAHLAPELLPQYIDQTIELSKMHVGSKSNSAQNQQFNSIVCVARYDLAKAKKMFDEIADDVQISSAAAFFRAQLAIYPDQVWEEFETMPQADERGTDYRIYVRNELLPVLAAKSDAAFWDGLCSSEFLKIDARILAK